MNKLFRKRWASPGLHDCQLSQLLEVLRLVWCLLCSIKYVIHSFYQQSVKINLGVRREPGRRLPEAGVPDLEPPPRPLEGGNLPPFLGVNIKSVKLASLGRRTKTIGVRYLLLINDKSCTMCLLRFFPCVLTVPPITIRLFPNSKQVQQNIFCIRHTLIVTGFYVFWPMSRPGAF